MTQETKVKLIERLSDDETMLLLQIAGHPKGNLTIEGADYRNPDLTKDKVRELLEKLSKEGVFDQVTAKNMDDDSETVYYSLSDETVEEVKEYGNDRFFDPYKAAEAILAKPQRIKRIEDKDYRPVTEYPW
jgi:transcription initiation factor IIE alpha subunit